jgi:hypothetical protein
VTNHDLDRENAYAGDVDAAQTYILRLDNRERGDAVRDTYEARIPTEAFRVILASAWSHDHQEVWRAACYETATLQKWFRFAEFDVSHLPDPVTLWRGGVCFFRDDQYCETPLSLT